MNLLIKFRSSLILVFLVFTIFRSNTTMAFNYNLEPCCDLCPAAKNAGNYNTKFLSLFSTLVEGQDDWLFRSDIELRNEFGPDGESLEALRRFNATLQADKNVQLVLVYQPTRGLVHANKLINDSDFDFPLATKNYTSALERFRSAGVITPDLTPLINEPVSTEEYFFRRDHHWTPHGAMRTAKLVANRIKSLSVYKELEKKKYSHKKEGLIHKRGSMQIAFSQLCRQEFADQYVQDFLIVQDDDTEVSFDNQDLFGEGEGLPEVTLVGTSNSKSAVDYHFDGFLKEFLSVDVLNEAMASGSFNGSLLQYFPSVEFQDEPPKILIWEIPAYHSISRPLFYRQVTPLIYDGCQADEPILTQNLTLKSGVNELLFYSSSNGGNMSSGELIVDFRFQDSQLKNLNATVWYINGRKERIRIQHPQRADTRGRFVFELKSIGEWKDFNYMSIDIDWPAGVDTTRVEAKLCYKKYAGQGG